MLGFRRNHSNSQFVKIKHLLHLAPSASIPAVLRSSVAATWVHYGKRAASGESVSLAAQGRRGPTARAGNMSTANIAGAHVGRDSSTYLPNRGQSID